jgi:hypothetical protein
LGKGGFRGISGGYFKSPLPPFFKGWLKTADGVNAFLFDSSAGGFLIRLMGPAYRRTPIKGKLVGGSRLFRYMTYLSKPKYLVRK